MVKSIFRSSREANSIVRGEIWPKSKLTQAIMYVLVTDKYEKDQIKNSEENVMTLFSPLKVYGIFFSRCSTAANFVVGGPIWPKFEPIQDIMHVLITYKFEKDRTYSNREKMVRSIF